MNLVAVVYVLAIVLFFLALVFRFPNAAIGLLCIIAIGQLALVITTVHTVEALHMGSGSVLAMILSIFVPVLPLITLVVVARRASALLTSGGYQVGLLGALPPDESAQRE